MVGVSSKDVLSGGLPTTGCSVSRMCRRTTRSLGSIRVRLMKSKGHQAFEQAAEIGKQGGELAVDGDRFGDFEQRLVACPRGVRTERCGGWHQGVEPAFPTVPQAGARQISCKTARIRGVTATSSTPCGVHARQQGFALRDRRNPLRRDPKRSFRSWVVELAVFQHCSSSCNPGPGQPAFEFEPELPGAVVKRDFQHGQPLVILRKTPCQSAKRTR